MYNYLSASVLNSYFPSIFVWIVFTCSLVLHTSRKIKQALWCMWCFVNKFVIVWGSLVFKNIPSVFYFTWRSIYSLVRFSQLRLMLLIIIKRSFWFFSLTIKNSFAWCHLGSRLLHLASLIHIPWYWQNCIFCCFIRDVQFSTINIRLNYAWRSIL